MLFVWVYMCKTVVMLITIFIGAPILNFMIVHGASINVGIIVIRNVIEWFHKFRHNCYQIYN